MGKTIGNQPEGVLMESGAKDWRDLAINMVMKSHNILLDDLAKLPVAELLRLLGNRETCYRLLERSSYDLKISKMVDIALSEIADITLPKNEIEKKGDFVLKVRKAIDDFLMPQRESQPWRQPFLTTTWMRPPPRPPRTQAEIEADRERAAAEKAERAIKRAVWNTRNADVVARRERGETYSKIAEVHEMSRERVRQIVMKEERKSKRARWLKDNPPEPLPRNIRPGPLEENPTDTRIWNTMKNAECRTVQELASKTDLELLEWPNFGMRSLKRLRELTQCR